jgi:polyhydroxybutyrate depolymerase
VAFTAVVALAVGTLGASTAIATPGSPRPACRAPAAAATTTETIPVDGAIRSYRLAIPAGRGTQRRPLILNFHGYGSTAVEQAFYSQLESKGPARGFVVATPQGTGTPAFWNILPQLPHPDDVSLATTIIDRLEVTSCVDPSRVYVTGISNGGGLTSELGCRLTRQLAAIAPVAGVNLVAGCSRGLPISVLVFHGNTDPTVPYRGGDPGGLLRSEQLPSVPQAVATWAEHDRCMAKPVVRQVSVHVVRTDYSRCASGVQVQLYTIEGGGHTWPGALDVARLGPVTHEINAADLIITFFSHFRRPAA